MGLRDLALEMNWQSLELPKAVTLRIGLHAGPLFPCFDAVMGRRVFMGTSVIRTARIESIAEEGQIFASGAFAALAAAENVSGFEFDYVGMKELPKAGGKTSLFLLRPKSL